MAQASSISLEAASASLPELWSPRVVAEVNDHLLKVARVHGEFPWHTHDHEDELFLVLRGALTIGRAPEDGGPVTLLPGECFVIPHGLRHNTSAAVETLIALIEPATTLHSGTEQTPLTRSLADQLRPLPAALARSLSLAAIPRGVISPKPARRSGETCGSALPPYHRHAALAPAALFSGVISTEADSSTVSTAAQWRDLQTALQPASAAADPAR